MAHTVRIAQQVEDPHIETVTAARLGNVIGEVLSQVQFGVERVILACKGQPAAAIIPIEDLPLLEGTVSRPLSYAVHSSISVE